MFLVYSVDLVVSGCDRLLLRYLDNPTGDTGMRYRDMVSGDPDTPVLTGTGLMPLFIVQTCYKINNFAV